MPTGAREEIQKDSGQPLFCSPLPVNLGNVGPVLPDVKERKKKHLRIFVCNFINFEC